MPKLKIFISHARDDSAQAQVIYHRLKERAYEPWIDAECLRPGQLWEREIKKAIKAAHIFLLVLTANSIAKRGVIQKEIRIALDTQQEKLDSDVFIVPVRLEKCSIPEALGEIQTANLFEENGWKKLVQTLDAQYAALFGISEMALPVPSPAPEIKRTHNADGTDHFEIQALIVDEQSKSTRRSTFSVSTSTLAGFAKRGQATAIAQFFYLVRPILENPDIIFRGIMRPLSESEFDQERIYIYAGMPLFDIEWDENREKGLVKRPTPQGRVFLVLVSRQNDAPTDGEDRWRIERWNWAIEDPLVKRAPEGWDQRYRKLIFRRG